jgi:CRISPR/Cas system CMR subunit Cmr4 (Cas7 group RAMP superfamily)
MYGVEWGQEAIVAEALAQTAVHSAEIGGFLVDAERAAARTTSVEKGEKGPGVMELIAEVRRNEKLRRAARNEDAVKVRDGVLARAKEEMIALAARVRVRPEEVEERTAEMFNAALFVAAAAAFVREGKQPKFDFFLM